MSENHDSSIRAAGTPLQEDGEDPAIAAFSETIRLRPDDVEALYGRGLAYQHRNKFEQALIDYDRAIMLDPDHIDALFKRSAVHRLTGAFDKAGADFDQAIQLLWRRQAKAEPDVKTRGLPFSN